MAGKRENKKASEAGLLYRLVEVPKKSAAVSSTGEEARSSAGQKRSRTSGLVHVASDYEIVEHTYIQAVPNWGEPAVEYDPLDYPALVTELAKVASGDEERVKKFARQWGLTKPLVVDNQSHYMNLQLMVVQAETMSAALSLMECMQQGDLRRIIELTKLLSSGDSGTGRRGVGSPSSSSADTESEATAVALRAIRDTIEDHLDASEFSAELVLDWDDRPNTRKVRLRAANLLAACYYHLAEIHDSNRPIGRCERCGEMIVRQDPRQRYCAPGPRNVERAATKGTKVESHCAQAARAKRYRDGKKAAERADSCAADRDGRGRTSGAKPASGPKAPQ